MVKLNLLPWRAQERAARKREYLRQIIMLMMTLLVLAAFLHISLAQAEQKQQVRNQLLIAQEASYEVQIKEVERLKIIAQTAQQQLSLLTQLQSMRTAITNLFAAFSATMPEGIYFSRIEREGNTLSIAGYADVNAKITQLMHNMEASSWLGVASLQSIKTTKYADKYNQSFQLSLLEQASPINLDEQAG
jgi:type IV pilus assembly protein PilN